MELAVEGLRDAKQRVDSRRPSPGLEPCNRRLRRPAEVRELRLGDPAGAPLGCDLVCHPREEPPLIRVDVSEALTELLDRVRRLDALGHNLKGIANLRYHLTPVGELRGRQIVLNCSNGWRQRAQ